jgi:hypothetical protein
VLLPSPSVASASGSSSSSPCSACTTYGQRHCTSAEAQDSSTRTSPLRSPVPLRQFAVAVRATCAHLRPPPQAAASPQGLRVDLGTFGWAWQSPAAPRAAQVRLALPTRRLEQNRAS